LALVQNRLDHISHQMGWVMTRTARSPIFSQSHDFFLLHRDARGTLISQADGIPIHTAARLCRARHPARTSRIRPPLLDRTRGRVPAERSYHRRRQPPAGLGDRPAGVRRGKMVAFACNRAHQAEYRRRCGGTYTIRRPPRSSMKASASPC